MNEGLVCRKGSSPGGGKGTPNVFIKEMSSGSIRVHLTTGTRK